MGALFLSGVAGLIYQVLWVRQLTLVMGSTVYAVATVLATFMAGLGLGSAVAARYVDSLPLRTLPRLYSYIEVGIAAFGLAFPFLLQLSTPLLADLYGAGASSAALVGLFRFGSCALLLLIPTTLMGATLPVLTAFLGPSSAEDTDTNDGAKESGKVAGRLYAANTLGAMAGSLATGVFLLYLLGVSYTTGLAILLNLTAAALVWNGSQKSGVRNQKEDVVRLRRSKSEKKAKKKEAFSEVVAPWVVSIVIALSGMAALMDEVAWTRALVLLIGPTTYGFSFVISAVIAGIALGSAVASRWTARSRHPASLLAVVQMLAAVASLAVIQIIRLLPVPVGQLVRANADRMSWLLQVELFWILLLLIVPSFLFGAAFPLAVRLLYPSVRATGKATGRIYAWNTVGAVSGSLLAGFFLLPWIGMESTLYVAVIIQAIAGTLVLVAVSRKALRLALAAVALGASVLAPFVLPGWDRELLSGGTYKYAAYLGEGEVLDFLRRGDLVFYREDEVTTVSVKQVGSKTSLAVDGKVDATNAGDMLTQRLLAHVPLLLHPEPREICVIGYGSGVTAGSALTHDIERLDAVEISPGVVEGSLLFRRDNRNALDDERLELHVTDGRNHLLLTDRRYDVIISEPSNPWMSGVSQLFTRDFFELARTRLGPGGLFCQWAHIYNMATDDLKTIVAGFTDAFPQSALFHINEGDVLLVGAESELPDIESAALARRIEEPAIAEDLATVEVRNLFTFASLYALGTPELADWAADAARHTDDHPLLEFRAPRFMHADTGQSNRNAILEAASTAVPPDTIRRLLSAPDAEDVLSRARMLEQAESFQWAFETFTVAARLAPERLEAHEGMVRTALAIEQPLAAEEVLRSFSPAASEPFSVAASIGLGLLYRNLGRYDEALQELDRALRADRRNFRALLLAAEVEGEIGRIDMMENLARMVLEHEYDHPEAGALLAEAAMRREELELALSRALHVLERHPEQTRALQVAAISYAQTGKIEEARSRFGRLIELEPDAWRHYNNFARLEMASDRFPAAAELYEKAVDLNPRNVEGYVGLREAARIAGDSKRLERAESMLKVLGVQ